jgi:hypothetical protein
MNGAIKARGESWSNFHGSILLNLQLGIT